MTKRWYHYGMISSLTQMVVVLGCILALIIAIAVYKVLEVDIEVFSGVCELQNTVDDEGEETPDLVALCGDETVHLNLNLERSVYYHELTTGTRPAIVCVKTESEYLGDIRWRCTIDTEDTV